MSIAKKRVKATIHSVVLSRGDVLKFFSCVDKGDDPEDCWGWRGQSKQTSAAIGISGYVFPAHRISWVIHNNKPLHSTCRLRKFCGSKTCTNPKHLFPGATTSKHRGRKLYVIHPPEDEDLIITEKVNVNNEVELITRKDLDAEQVIAGLEHLIREAIHYIVDEVGKVSSAADKMLVPTSNIVGIVHELKKRYVDLENALNRLTSRSEEDTGALKGAFKASQGKNEEQLSQLRELITTLSAKPQDASPPPLPLGLLEIISEQNAAIQSLRTEVGQLHHLLLPQQPSRLGPRAQDYHLPNRHPEEDHTGNGGYHQLLLQQFIDKVGEDARPTASELSLSAEILALLKMDHSGLPLDQLIHQKVQAFAYRTAGEARGRRSFGQLREMLLRREL